MTASPCNGVSRYAKIKRDLTTLCRHDPSAVITTMLDFYALPSDTPGMGEAAGATVYDKVCHVEERIREDIGAANLIPNLMLHEFEALLFSNPECFSYCNLPARTISQLCEIRAGAETPEHINNDPNTAPSKRILSLYPGYNKVLDGFNIAQDIGIDTMRKECKHFDLWLQKIEALA